MKDLLKKFKRPQGLMLVLTYIVTALFIAWALAMLFVDYEGIFLSIVAYTSFGFAGLSLAYSIYTVVIYASILKKKVVTFLVSHKFTRRLIENWGFRTVVTSSVSFIVTVANSVVNAYLGIATKSIWFGALAAYYIFLALMRSDMLFYHRSKKDFDGEALIRAKKYTRCGILLLILNAALSSAIAQMIFDDRAFEYKEWLIYAFAAYAFYKVIMSVKNVIKARRQDDLTIQAIREINIVDAAVSILALQTALLHTFSDGTVDISLFNTLTGCCVSALSYALSIYMIVKGTKAVKEFNNK